MYCVCIVSSVTCRSSSSCACYVNLGTITTATCCHIVGLPPDYLLALLAPHDSSFLSSAADGQPYLYFFLVYMPAMVLISLPGGWDEACCCMQTLALEFFLCFGQSWYDVS